jgi:hypothetical protein
MLVSGAGIAEPVCCAVDFNAKPRLFAVEIQHVRPGGMLTAKLQFVGTATQMLPKNDLGQRHLPSK